MGHPSFLLSSLLVAAGGAAGAWLRFLLGRFYVVWLGPIKASAFPWSTLTANIVGSLAMGLLVGWLARHGTGTGLASEGTRLFLAVGLLGGFTTFSAFSLEIVSFFERGAYAQAAFYAALSVAAGFFGLLAGLMLMRHPM